MRTTPATKGKGRAANAAQTKTKHLLSVAVNSGRKLHPAQVAAPGSRAAVAAMQRKRDQEARLNAPLEVTPPERRARLQKILRDMRGNDADTQARRVLLALEGGPCTSLELRKYLDCIQVSTRVHELRQRGFEIETVWVRQTTDAGKLHRVGLYVLRVRAR
ncbi:helix-turn-helix domain-containing protein [Extensimonas sp. H3M7-6]|uniref:helix-turn-helix domain-containing protein n=1 Tax=Extensimonas soli TaxID=3031322 RepID=UPI0023DC4724|nr:helix-turn-helix domain-containing protein [Extensimonas sp. H3M7-6]MDF1482214.1 helix-turn-helix domain-containing protein [Extensimonas sp. H3M7-6]